MRESTNATFDQLPIDGYFFPGPAFTNEPFYQPVYLTGSAISSENTSQQSLISLFSQLPEVSCYSFINEKIGFAAYLGHIPLG